MIGDGRGRHDQQVRRSHFSTGKSALSHTKSVLFVHHHQARILQPQMFGQQPLGAHKQIGVPRCGGVGRRPPPSGSPCTNAR